MVFVVIVNSKFSLMSAFLTRHWVRSPTLEAEKLHLHTHFNHKRIPCQGRHFALLCLHKLFTGARYNFLIHAVITSPSRCHIRASTIIPLIRTILSRVNQGTPLSHNYTECFEHRPRGDNFRCRSCNQKLFRLPKSLNWMFQWLCSCSGHDSTCKRSQAAQLLS